MHGFAAINTLATALRGRFSIDCARKVLSAFTDYGAVGRRLRPLTLHRPKALVPLVDRPQIVYMLDSLPAMCDEVIIAVNYGFEAMREFFRTHECGIEVRVVEEAKPLGTAGAIKNIQRHVRGTFAVYNGDVVDTIELDRFVEAHRQRRGIGTIAGWPVHYAS